ncbi:MAG: tRNA-dihydrouridine synthase A [Yoonia sp.]|jgi:tRNA-dihydrouridine synthase A
MWHINSDVLETLSLNIAIGGWSVVFRAPSICAKDAKDTFEDVGDIFMPSNTATQAARFSVAPMMDWTDRHCRYLHRLMSQYALLYTEMVTAPAIIHGDRDRLLGFQAAEQPLALQLGGSDPAQLAQAARIGADYGYAEVNLNCGCPSDRVQSGSFGAILMENPKLVADCVAAMIAAVDIPVTVKCRIGVDEQDPSGVLPDFLAQVSAAGVDRFSVHARKAWLQGLSPKENRDIPPLNYDLVFDMKGLFPHLHLSVNGGIETLDSAQDFLDRGMDGVMIGRAAYHTPAQILLDADQRIFGGGTTRSAEEVVHLMLPYIADHLAQGGRLGQITRHMMGLFQGRPGARGWRRHLSENVHVEGAGPEVVLAALDHVTRLAA